MSFRYSAGLIGQAPTVVGPVVFVTDGEGGSASGIWSTASQSNLQALGTWPKRSIPKALWVWGLNNSGQLGIGDTTIRSDISQVGTLTTWLAIQIGQGNGIAIKTDGTIWCWGAGAYGTNGQGNITSYSSPKQVGSLATWSKIAGSGFFFNLATTTSGTLYSWGNNDYGQLGLGNRTSRSSPVQVGSLATWSKIATGRMHGLAIKTDGTLWSWGHNSAGQLGLGNTTYYSSPKQVGALTIWLKVSGGNYSTLAIKTDGTLWAWGRNDFGQLGNGNITQQNTPVQIGGLTNWLNVASGPYQTVAVKTDGTLWTWGWNNHGQLGLGDSGTYTRRSSPVQVGSLTTWASCSSGAQYCMALKTDGTLWSWGRNNEGQLGQGNTTYKSSPIQIGALTTWAILGISDHANGGAIKS